MTPEECREFVDITGCARLGDAESGAEWCETHGNDWPCQVGRLNAAAHAYAERRVAAALEARTQADLLGHEVSEDCVCGPTPIPVTRDDGSVGWVHVHHSLDNREATE